MRALVVFASFLLLSLSSCLEFPEMEEGYAPLVLKSATGFSSETGEIYVQHNIGAGLEVSTSKPEITVSSAVWTIETSSYNGVEISHKFTTLGRVTLTVDAILSTGATASKSFVVNVVQDISKNDPIIMKSQGRSAGKTAILFLFSRERLRYASSTELFYIGSMTDWKNIPISYKSYVINDQGEAIVVTDVGKYVGFTLESADGDYEMALVHSQSVWVDFSGSAYVQKANTGKIRFGVRGLDIIALGDNWVSDLPGNAGDMYFRFSQSSAKVDLYFKLEADYSANAFYTYQLANGQFSSPVLLFPVEGKPSWGRAELLSAQYLDRVITFRFGPDYHSPSVLSGNLQKSSYFSTFKNGIEIQFQKI